MMVADSDVISGDEIFTDAFEPIEVDDVAYEVDTQMVTFKEGAVDIG